jgi:hypothetical protein
MFADRYELRIAFPRAYPVCSPVVMIVRPVLAPYNGVRLDCCKRMCLLVVSASVSRQTVEGGCITTSQQHTWNAGANPMLRLVALLSEIDESITDALKKYPPMVVAQYPVAAFTAAHDRRARLPTLSQPLPLHGSTQFCKASELCRFTVYDCFAQFCRFCQMVQSFSANVGEVCGVRIPTNFEVILSSVLRPPFRSLHVFCWSYFATVRRPDIAAGILPRRTPRRRRQC